MLEKDLYGPVKEWLKGKGYEPKAEVAGCDILAVREDVTLAVELKVTLNLEVILQAADRQRLADIVYIAVPKKGKAMTTQRWKLICHLLKRLEIGLLLVHVRGGHEVEEAIAPVAFDRERSRQTYKRKRKAAINEYHKRHGDHNVGGVNKVKLVTVYRENALVIAHLLAVHGPLSPKKLRELGADKTKTQSILAKNFYGWYENISKGLYGITPLGMEAIKVYRDVVDEMMTAYAAEQNETEEVMS